MMSLLNLMGGVRLQLPTAAMWVALAGLYCGDRPACAVQQGLWRRWFCGTSLTSMEESFYLDDLQVC